MVLIFAVTLTRVFEAVASAAAARRDDLILVLKLDALRGGSLVLLLH